MEDPVSMCLYHLGVRVETGVAKLGNLLCQELDTLGGVAKDYRLVDLKLLEERVKAMDFCFLFDKCVVLRYTA